MSPLKAEYLLPDVAGALVKEDRMEVRALISADKWFGATYKEDAPYVKASFKDLEARGVYPESLIIST